MPKLKHIRLSTHSKQRYSERTEYQRHEYREYARWALKKGVRLRHIKEARHRHLLISSKPRVIKIYYKSSIYVFDRYTNRLITMYPLSSSYLEALYEELERSRGRKR